MFNVELVYGKKFEGGAVKYFVKWKGYSLEDSSYEPITYLGNAVYNVRGFERKMSNLIFRLALLPAAKRAR